MPYSYPEFKNEVKEHIKQYIPTSSNILDVGPGSGTYYDLLNESGYKLDCIEIWEPYIEQFKLHEKYNIVFNGDIRTFDLEYYDYIIMGDVLEHLSYQDARILMDEIKRLNKKCLVAVPYSYIQGSYEGNVHETHLQPDLTVQNMFLRYPELNLLYGNEIYGYYINYPLESKLTDIANNNRVDKGTEHYEAHGYTEVYQKYISSTDNIGLLEIGIWHCDSIRMWNQYNPNIDVHAVDIDPNVNNFLTGNEKCNIYIGDQGHIGFLNEFIVPILDKIDVVIDDGSHKCQDILTSFAIMYPHLKHGAKYFIEDLHATEAEKDNLIANLILLIGDEGYHPTDVKFFCNGKLMLIIK
jgi:predicted nucleic-acid-binding Zn-ribbon protein